MKLLIIYLVILLSCSMVVLPPKTEPPNPNSRVEAFCFKDGKIYVLFSEIEPGKYYFEGSTLVPKRKRAWCEIYVALDNRIVLLKKINVKIIPAQPERWEIEKE